MDVLMLTSEFYPNWGGIGTYVTELARNTSDEMKIHILTPKRTKFGDGQGIDGATLEGNELLKLPSGVSIHYLGAARDTFMHYFYFQAACCRRVRLLVKKYDIDIVHSQNTMPDLFLAPKLLGVPIVTTVHSIEDERLPAVRLAAAASSKRLSNLERSEKMSLLLGFGLHAAGRVYFRNNRRYIAVSQWTKEQILRHQNVNAERIRVIPNGVDRNVFTPDNRDRAKEHFPELADIDNPKLLFFSRMTASKGAYVLMKAIPRILDKVDASFVFAGPGQRLPHRAGDHVVQLGYVAHERTPFLHALADIFTLPSFYENCPLTILEAMASGRPIVASNINGISELVTHEKEGLLTQPGNVNQLVEAIITLIKDDGLRTKLGRNARRTVQDRNDWKKVAAEVSDYYTWVLNESSAH
jgi:glycosyltransferase involved in cell wall biosynthesis